MYVAVNALYSDWDIIFLRGIVSTDVVDPDQNSLPTWRYLPRQKLLPVVRFETPYLAWLQEKMRSPTLDSYFALAANLGTHTFFMTFLPVLFWSGYPSLGRG